MKSVLKFEELAQFLLAYFIFLKMDFTHWHFWAFLLLPDLSMMGYAFGNKSGAIAYNFFHHKALAVALIVLSFYFQNQEFLFYGLILYAHSSMDRIFGYGLKEFAGFKYTHLGQIGKD